MCVLSMVVGHYYERYPFMQPQSAPQRLGDYFPPQSYPDFMDLVRKARLYDELNNQKDCPDPKKEEWLKQLESFMRERYGLEPK